MSLTLLYLALFCCLLLIALFAASEAALAATNRVRLRHLLRSQYFGLDDTTAGTGAARILSSELSSDAQQFIATITIAANMPLLAASAVTLWLARRHLDQWSQVALLCLAVAVATIALFQITPRFLVSRPGALERLWWVRPARLILTVLGPFVTLLLAAGRLLLRPLGVAGRRATREETIDTAEIRDLVETAQASGVIEETGRELIESIFTFGDTRVHDVMIPRPDIVALSVDATPAKVLDTFQESGFSRLPLYEGDADHIAGILHVKDILLALNETRSDEFVPRAMLRAPLFLPETRNIDEALAEMRARRTHLAVVIDEFGGTAGLVTVEDILEELVGEIIDEHDRKIEDPFVQLAEDCAMVDAFLHADELKSNWNLTLPTGEFDTVAGFMIEQLGRELSAGDTIETEDATLLVHSMRGRRPRQVLITRKPATSNDEATD